MDEFDRKEERYKANHRIMVAITRKETYASWITSSSSYCSIRFESENESRHLSSVDYESRGVNLRSAILDSESRDGNDVGWVVGGLRQASIGNISRFIRSNQSPHDNESWNQTTYLYVSETRASMDVFSGPTQTIFLKGPRCSRITYPRGARLGQRTGTSIY